MFPFERLTDPARRVMVLAQEEAIRLHHRAVDSGHVLLAIARQEETVAANVLDSLGVSREQLRSDVEAAVGRGEAVGSDDVPFAPRASQILQWAKDEASRLGHNCVATEHLLLGLLRDEESIAVQVLGKATAAASPHQKPLETMRGQVRHLLGEH